MDKDKSKRFILPCLLISSFSSFSPIMVVSVLLVEISQSFDIPLGYGGQIRLVTNMIAFMGSIIIAELSSRTRHKTILLLGLLGITVSAIGSSLSPNFGILLLFSALSGIGMASVISMTNAMVADYYPEERRSKILGYLGVGGGLGFLAGGIIVSYLSVLGGWRLAYLGFTGVVSGLSLLINLIFLPPTKNIIHQDAFFHGIRTVLKNKSALGTLSGNFLASVAIQGLYFYSYSFLKNSFHTSTEYTGIIYAITAFFFMIGSYLSGFLVQRIGARTSTIFGILTFSIVTVLYHFTPTLSLTIALIFIGNFFEGIRYSSLNILSLRQVPDFSGSMMSLTNAAANLGYSIGAGIGGLLLLFYGWRAMGIFYGCIGILSIIMIIDLVKS
jgi:predicted MFS family arabinose efflux permease